MTLEQEAYEAFAYRGVMEATALFCDIPTILAKLEENIPLDDQEAFYAAAYVRAVEPCLTRITTAVEALAEAATGIPASYTSYRVHNLDQILVEMNA